MSTRRRFPWWLLAITFIVVPMAEIYLLIQVGQVIGAWWTVGLLILSGVVGSWLMKREGRRAWQALQEALQGGRMPARELADGMLILIGGTLMLAPGFLSDLVGMVLILPITRPLGRRLLTRVVTRKLTQGFPAGAATFNGGRAQAPYGNAAQASNARHPGDGDVIPGEVVD